jgi:CheY-like chemotaxis protein
VTVSKQELPVILLVEDNAAQLEMRRLLLERLELDVHAVMSFEDASELLRTLTFDAVVTDIDLGGGLGNNDGVAVAQIARQIDRSLPVVGYSAIVRKGELGTDIELFQEFFQKGGNTTQLVQAFEQIAELARGHRRSHRGDSGLAGRDLPDG